MRRKFLIVGLVAALGVAGAAPASARLADGDVTKTITVRMSEFKFEISATRVKKGTRVIFNLINDGDEPHDIFFTSLQKKSKYIAAGKTGKLIVTFTKAGNLPYLCTVGEHAFRGMSGRFRVTK
jgi:plastocyanin